ncbi:murein biosynthesis integral membrane protein MurJ [Candidatus Parcubacteria bacterium]|nr:MAG: murein biosynthesis integral membrane protein MurJ [Candidatus Parcubacteria bacterium]
MIKRLFSGKINSITLAALLVALSSLVSRFLGIFRDRILAGEFGAGDTLDVYYAAFRIPDFIFNMLVLGALSAGFIPIFSNLLKTRDGKSTKEMRIKNKEAWNLASNILNVLALALIVISFLLITFSPYLSKLIVPGFSPDKQALVARLTMIMYLSPIFLGISSVFGGILQSFKRFFVYSLSPILYNIGIIIGALFFVPIWGVFGLAWGVVLGTFLHMLVQIPMVFKLGYSYKPIIDLKNKYFKKISIMMVPRTLSLAIAQINFLVITVMASSLESGSLAVFNFANNLQSFPIGIFGISFAVAAFPVLSSVAFDKKKLIENVSHVFRQIIFFIIPATVLMLALRAQVVRVILGTGQFGWQDTVATIDALSFFTISLFAQASIPLLVRVFYARHNSKTPFFIGLVSIAINIILSYYLPKIEVAQTIIDPSGLRVVEYFPLGVAGLALAFSIANIVNFVLLWIVLKFELGSMDEKRIFISISKFSVSAIAAGIIVQAMENYIAPIVDMERFWGISTQMIIAGTSGVLVYVAFCSLLKSEELFNFWHSIKRRLPGQKIETGDQGEARGI